MEYEDPTYYFDLPQEQVLSEKAPLSRRVLAYIIDFLLYYLFLYAIFIQAFQYSSGIHSGLLTIEYLSSNQWIISMLLGIYIASSVIFGFYMALCEYVFGKTIGKHLMGLWVEGEPGLWGFVGRNLLKSTFIILLPLDLFGLLTNNQRVIDQLIRVNVLYTKRIVLTEDFI